MKYILILILLFGTLYATEPTINIDSELNPDGTMTAKNSMSGTFGYGYIGEFADYGDVLSLNADGKWYKYDGTEETTLVMAAESCKKNKLHKFMLTGFATKYNWAWTAGTKVYPTTDGAITQTSPDNNRNILGEATKADEIYFNPDSFRGEDIVIDYGEYLYFPPTGWSSIDEAGAFKIFLDGDRLRIDRASGFGWAQMWGFDIGDLTTYVSNSITIVGDFIPNNSNTYDVGTSVLRFAESHIYDGYFYDDVVIDDDCTAERYISEVITTTVGGDVTVTSCTVLNVDSAIADITISGFTGGVAGHILHLYNSDTNNVILEDDQGTANQDIKTNTGADVTITAEGGATLIYDGTDGVWRITGIAL